MNTSRYSETAEGGQQPIAPTDIRLRLLEQGYTPLANDAKACFLDDWPTLKVTPKLVSGRWRRTRDYQDTGIRCDNGLMVIDLDINHALADVVADRIERDFPILADALLRWGSGNKRAWFLRCAEVFKRISTRRWLAPGTVADDGAHCVEVFASPTRQFGSFGANKRDEETGEALIMYEWAEEPGSPLDVPLADLPVMSKADVLRLVDTVEEVLAAAGGWEPILRSKKGESYSDTVYDLTAEMVFECNDGVDRTLAELQDEAARDKYLRCSASWIEGPSAKRRNRCLVGLTKTGLVTVWESSTEESHMAAALRDVEGEQRRIDISAAGDKLAKLAAQTAEQQQKKLNKVEDRDDFATVTAKLLRSYALCPSQQLQVVPIYADSTDMGMTMAGFRSQQLRFGYTETGPKGGKRHINPVDSWLSDRERLVEVAGLRMRPDMPRPLYWDGERQFVNTYAAPVHVAEPEGVEAFVALIEHLVPDPVERRWFLDWLAHKYQHPSVPGPGVVMVSRRQGAGRSTLFIILRQLFGSAYVRKVDGVTLTGDGGQSQYNTWLANSLLVQVDELFNAGTGAHLWQRKKAYDRIKGLIDPASRDVEIIQKTLNNYVTRTFTTFFMATNNPNALPLDEDDRRICVITNGEVMAEAPEVAALVNSVREGGEFKPGFITAVADMLASRSLEGFDVFAPPPMFEGKRTMIALNMTDAGEAAEEVLRELPGDYITRKAFIERTRQKMGAAAADHKHIAQEAAERLDKAWVYINRTKIKDNGSKADVWARDKHAANMWQGIALADREAALAPCENLTLKLSATMMAALEGKLKVVK